MPNKTQPNLTPIMFTDIVGYSSMVAKDEKSALKLLDEFLKDIIHDLNRPIPDTLSGTFDFIYDGGTLEHVFDLDMHVSPQAFPAMHHLQQFELSSTDSSTEPKQTDSSA